MSFFLSFNLWMDPLPTEKLVKGIHQVKSACEVAKSKKYIYNLLHE